ncbi:MAG TPA: FtsQ-type POTRA domain-containing protein [Actinomycetota bacterium]|nr:FtsQ-type POTRA domain-containing protein [Actinomycetota bacterium]
MKRAVGTRRIAIAVVILVSLVAAADWFWNSSWLKLHTVQVSGLHHTTRAQVLGVAALVDGTRLSAISSATVARRVDGLPWVASATVTHVLPSTIRIAVTERTPAVVVQGAGRPYLVDVHGAVLAAGSGPYPQVTGLGVDTLQPGGRISGPAFAAAVAVLTSLPVPLRAEVTQVSAPSADAVTISLTGQTTISYGTATDLASKNTDVTDLLGGGQSFQSINVSAPDHPAAIPR